MQVFRKQIKDTETGRRQSLQTTYSRFTEREAEDNEREREESGSTWAIAVKTTLFRVCRYFESDSTTLAEMRRGGRASTARSADVYGYGIGKLEWETDMGCRRVSSVRVPSNGNGKSFRHSKTNGS